MPQPALRAIDTARSTLRIIPDESSLHGHGPFLEDNSWPLGLTQQQPRALRGLAKIVNGGLCHRCGSCVGICPTGVLGLDDTAYPKVVAASACTDCDLCVKVCPGDEFKFDLLHQKRFGTAGDAVATHGNFLEGIVAHATNSEIREHSTSGGLVTAILLDLLRRKEIDGAVTIVSDADKLWKGKPVIARSEAELKAAMKSKYAISPTNAVFAEILKIPGRYALVGLPCQIHGFIKACELDARLRERVVLTIGLFCHAAIEHEAFEVIWKTIGNKAPQVKRFISRIGKHPGTPYVEFEDKSMRPVYFPEKTGYRPSSIEMINILYRLFTPQRCTTCFDASAEFADIAVGDPWMAPPEKDVNFYDGWSFALIRSEKAKELCADLARRGEIVSKPVTRKEALACNRLMATEKRWRAFRMIETQRRQGKPIPEYGIETPKHGFEHFLKTELHVLSHIFCFLPALRPVVLRFMLSDGGYWLLWLNHKRRAIRFWIRDTKAMLKRKIVGRR